MQCVGLGRTGLWIVVMAAWPLTTMSAVAQKAPAGSETVAGQARLTGTWTLNRAISSMPPAQAPGQGQPGTSGGRSGGRPGNGGGYGGGGYSGGSPGSVNPEQALQMRTLQRLVMNVPETLTITVAPDAVTVVDDQDASHRFQVNGKKEKTEFDNAKIDTKTKWEQDILTQDMSAGVLKVKTTYQASVDGTQLVVTMKADNGSRSGPAIPQRRVYERRQ